MKITSSAYTILGAIAVVMSQSAACGDDPEPPMQSGGVEQTSGAGGASGAGTGGASGAGAPDIELFGSFNLTLQAANSETMSAALTSIVGKVNDGPTPSTEVWTRTSEANGCKLFVPRPVFCEPACGSAARCVDDGKCAPYPKATTIGTVTLSGVGAEPLTMDPIVNNYQPKAGSMVPYPPCAEGSNVMLRAPSVELELSAKCIAPLDFTQSLTLQKGQPIRVSWGAPGDASLARIAVKFDLSHHGGTKGKIECDVADTGSLEVPASLGDALVDLGVSGFPTVTVTRKASAAGSGKKQNLLLNVTAPIELPVMIPGLISCGGNTDCPSGQSCQADRKCM